MKKQGIIVKIENNVAEIRVDRASSCGGNCVSCKGCPSAAVCIRQTVHGSFAVGDRVLLEKRAGRVLFEAICGYGIPSLFFILGAVFGYQIWETEQGSVLLGFGALFFAILLVKVFSRYIHHDFTVQKLEASK